jgi:hypothetical protein
MHPCFLLSSCCAARQMTLLLFIRNTTDHARAMMGAEQKRFLLVLVEWRSHAVYWSRARSNMKVTMMVYYLLVYLWCSK